MQTLPIFRRLVLTGAAGRLGSVLREPLGALCETLVISDLREPAVPAQANESFVACDLADNAAVKALVTGADRILHFGGMSQEGAFADLLPANFAGQFNIYDAALEQGVPRVILASSSHAIGYHGSESTTTADSAHRADSLYGVSKAYGETLARFYHDRYGIETACLRIGSCFPQPKSMRCLKSWLSPRDLIELVRCALTVESLGYAMVWGISANQQTQWLGDDAARIGFHAQDCAEPWREEILRTRPELADDPHTQWQGGSMVSRDYRNPATLHPYPPPKPIKP